MKFSVAFALLTAQYCAGQNSKYEPHAINHDEVAQIPTNMRPAELQNLYAPYVSVQKGCVPFPAIDDKGDWSGGLDNDGPIDGQCKYSSGQTYSRQLYYKQETLAIMYAWYFPKTQSTTGGPSRRHFWLYVVVWMEMLSARVHGIQTTGQGIMLNYPQRGMHPMIGFAFDGKNGENTYCDGQGQGKVEVVVDYDHFTDAEKAAINNPDHWGGITVPFADAAFFKILEESQQKLIQILGWENVVHPHENNL